MKKKCFVTVVNEDYKEYLVQLIESHKLFCNFDLVVYTVNFTLSDFISERVIFKEYYDKNLWEYEKLNSKNMTKKEIKVKNLSVAIKTGKENDDFICLTDMAKFKGEETGIIISNWITTKFTLEFIGIW